jgi:hypothetical protein
MRFPPQDTGLGYEAMLPLRLSHRLGVARFEATKDRKAASSWEGSGVAGSALRRMLLKYSGEWASDRAARNPAESGRGAFQSRWLLRGVRKLGAGPKDCGRETTTVTLWPSANKTNQSNMLQISVGVVKL